MTNPLVSIIIPIYNAERYIKQCIDSVLTQTYRNLEVLAINDGSSDSTSQILDCLAIEDYRIRVIHKMNSGVSDTRNQGLVLSQGEYVMFLDADDYWIDNSILDKLVTVAVLHDLDVVRGEYVEVDAEGRIACLRSIPVKRAKMAGTVVNPSTFLEDILQSEYFLFVSLFRKSKLRNIWFNTERIFLEDAEYYLKVFSNNIRGLYIQDVFYAYRKHSQAITVRPHPQKLYDAFNFSRFCFKLSYDALDYEMKAFCAKEGIRNFLFDICVIAEGFRIGDLIKSYKKYKLHPLRHEATNLVKKYSIRGRLCICRLPLPLLFAYYRIKRLVRCCIQNIKVVLSNN